MNHDLISVRYHGNLADPETERARQRIHWMCAQAKGTDVLDLGCSQGIVTLILAREGFRCTGVDVEESSLDTARTALAKEAELVRNRAQFQIADATQLPFNDASFDTVIVGEVLEHLTQPSKILDEARRMLRPGGRLVITVPYGLNAYHDHKYSYYPISLLSLLEPRFRTVSIGTLTNYIVYVGTYDPTYDVNREPKGDRFDEYLKLEQGLEARCIEKERDLYELGTKLYGRIKILSAHTGNQAKEIRELRENLSTEKKLKDGMLARITEADAVRLKFGEIDSARLVAQQKADELRQEVARLKQQLGTLEDNHLARARQQEKEFQAALYQRDQDFKRQLTNQRLRQFACSVLPIAARALVVSKGDDDLLALDGRSGKHFPQGPGGVYAGHHPANSAEAIGQLDRLRLQGAEYLIFPASSFWWLDYYTEFRAYLESNCRLMALNEEVGLIFALRAGGNGQQEKFTVTFQKTAPAKTSDTTIAPKAASTASATTPNPSATPSVTKAGAATAAAARQPKVPGQLVVGGIMDVFTAACFSPECNLVTFRPDNWKAVLDANPIDLLLVESAWQGNGGSWQYKLASFKKPMGEEVVDVIDYCKARGIKTAFWNKEDPSHFDRFIHRARLFDHVFTTDADMIPKYREQIGHDRVSALPFAAQPRLHHPILETSRKHNVCFAGAYYALEHDERRADIDLVLRPALPFGLHIYDRQHGVVGPNAKAYQFPEIYHNCIQGRLEYDDMVKAYKWYKVFLNVNSVKNSPTMFSRRVFELLASGTPVISAHAKGIVEMLGTNLVHITGSEAETTAHLTKLLGDERYWAEIATRGIREILTRHTYRDRFNEVLTKLGLPSSPRVMPQVTAVARVGNRDDAQHLARVLAGQSIRDFNVTILAGKAATQAAAAIFQKELPGISVNFLPDSKDPATQLLELNASNYIWWVNPNDYYGHNFLHDAVLATTYSNPDVIGKHTYFGSSAAGDAPTLQQPGGEYQWSSHLVPGSMLVKSGKLTLDQWRACLQNRTTALAGLQVLSLDRFNYVHRGGHLYNSPTEQALSGMLV